jgi:hypothetical protein
VGGGDSGSVTADFGVAVLVVSSSASPHAARPIAATTATGAAHRSARLLMFDMS